jgi:trehalose 6-phosphate phosphatase
MHDAGMTLSLPPAPDPHWAWFFDIDGTLIELEAEPSPLRASHALPKLLGAIDRRVGGAVALVSGRTVTNILALISPLEMPLAGCHGVERRLADGRILRPAPAPGIDRARRLLTTFVGRHHGLLLEDKGLTLALHYRQAPHLETACRNVVEQALSGNLDVLAGKMAFEIKPRGYSKGTALAAFMAVMPFQGRTPVFLGDDLTDEDGFEAAAAQGGLGVLVGPPRPTKAMFRLENVSALHIWLTGLSKD